MAPFLHLADNTVTRLSLWSRACSIATFSFVAMWALNEVFRTWAFLTATQLIPFVRNTLELELSSPRMRSEKQTKVCTTWHSLDISRIVSYLLKFILVLEFHDGTCNFTHACMVHLLYNEVTKHSFGQHTGRCSEWLLRAWTEHFPLWGKALWTDRKQTSATCWMVISQHQEIRHLWQSGNQTDSDNSDIYTLTCS